MSCFESTSDPSCHQVSKLGFGVCSAINANVASVRQWVSEGEDQISVLGRWFTKSTPWSRNKSIVITTIWAGASWNRPKKSPSFGLHHCPYSYSTSVSRDTSQCHRAMTDLFPVEGWVPWSWGTGQGCRRAIKMVFQAFKATFTKKSRLQNMLLVKKKQGPVQN